MYVVGDMKKINMRQYFYKLMAIAPTALFSMGSFSVCPFCLPFYAGVFGLLGLQKGTYGYYFFIILTFGMIISLIYALYLSIKSKQYLLMLAVLCGFLVTIFSKLYDMKILLYLGLAIFVISILQIKKSCKSCATSENKKAKNKTN